MKKFDMPYAIFTGVISVIGLALLAALLLLSQQEEDPAAIHVRCVGDHLVFESLRTGDIQVIANKCKKTYPKSQAPVTEDK